MTDTTASLARAVNPPFSTQFPEHCTLLHTVNKKGSPCSCCPTQPTAFDLPSGQINPQPAVLTAIFQDHVPSLVANRAQVIYPSPANRLEHCSSKPHLAAKQQPACGSGLPAAFDAHVVGAVPLAGRAGRLDAHAPHQVSSTSSV